MKNKKKSDGIKASAADKAAIRFVDYRGMALQPGQRRTPAWLKQEGLCFVGCWECMSWRRYSGIATTWAEEDYAFEHSRQFIADIKKLGCNAVVVPYDYGNGEAHNEKEIALTKEFIRLAHAHGLKAGTYFRADIVWHETLGKKELSELEGGFQVNRDGRFVQPFGSAARNICHHHPGVMARFKRHIKRAIEDIQTDMLHLDGMIVGDGEGSYACRCPNCTADFRRFLVERYGHDRALAEQRFGHPFLEKIEPPSSYPRDAAPYDSGPVNPPWCEWMAFRCHWTSRVLADVAAFARKLNPDVVIEINNALPAVRENAALITGMDVIGVGHYTDASWSEDGYPPKFLADGKIIQRVRQFKLCRAANTFTLSYMSETNERELRQNLAHTAAFNLGNIGCIGFPPHMNFSNCYDVHFSTKCNFMQWLNANRPHYRNARSAAQIAIWRARENMGLSGRMAYAATMRMEQLLIETCRGFDFVFDESPKALAHYDLVIVPNLECMSLEQIEGLRNYVENGGSLLVGQDSAMYDLWHRRRIENPWAGLFGKESARNVTADAVAATPAGIFVAAGAQSATDQFVFTKQGKGRAVYAPMVVDPATQPSLMTIHGELNCGLDYTNWIIPERADEFNRAIDWLMNGRETVRVIAERGLLAEFLEQDRPRRSLVHLVNLKPGPQSSCRVDIRLRTKTRDIKVLYPPTDTPPRWRVEYKNGVARVTFDLLDVYAIIVT